MQIGQIVLESNTPRAHSVAPWPLTELATCICLFRLAIKAHGRCWSSRPGGGCPCPPTLQPRFPCASLPHASSSPVFLCNLVSVAPSILWIRLFWRAVEAEEWWLFVLFEGNFARLMARARCLEAALKRSCPVPPTPDDPPRHDRYGVVG